MKISKTLLIPIFLMIGSCFGIKKLLEEQYQKKVEAQSYLTHIVGEMSGYGYSLQPPGYHNFFNSFNGGAPWPHGSNKNCENFYLAYKDHLNNLEMHPNSDEYNGDDKPWWESQLERIGDKNGDGIIDGKDSKMWLDEEDTRITAGTMYSFTDMNNDGYITEDEASFCLTPFFSHYAMQKLNELFIKVDRTRTVPFSLPKSLEVAVFISKKVESFLEDLEKIAPELNVPIPTALPQKEL